MFSVEFHPIYDATVGNVEGAIRLGAEAVAVGISAGVSNQVAMFEMLTKVVEEASAWGLPVVCHAYPSGEMCGDRKGSTESVLYASPRRCRTRRRHREDLVHRLHRGIPQGRRVHPAIVVAAGGARVSSPLDAC